MKFYDLCQTYDQLEQISSTIEMIDVLSKQLSKASSNEIGKLALLTLGKVYPNFRGIELMVAENLIIKALAISTGKNAKSILSFVNRLGDIGEATYHLLNKKTQSTLLAYTNKNTQYEPNVLEIWHILDKIAKTTGEGSTNKKIRILSGVLSQISALEAKFLVRMVSSRLRLGVATQLLLESLSLAKTGTRENKEILERAYNKCSDIGYVAEILYKKGIVGVQDIGVKVFTPVRVMLAQRLSSAEEILNKLNGECALEYKYDGLRAQIHYNGKSVQIFSRRAENITHQFPDIINQIKEASIADKYIIEGEIVAFDSEKNKILPFQFVSQRKRKHDIKEKIKEIPVKLFLFDVLYMNTKSTLDTPYLERRKLLKQIVSENNTISYSHYTLASNTSEIDLFFQEALKSNCEGIMGKDISENSIYQAGARGWNWIKYKADYIDKLADSFDLVIVGADYGKGKRAGLYGTFLLACFDEEENNYKTFSKVATGFSDNDLQMMFSELRNLKREDRPNILISEIECDVWFELEMVIEVSGAEITISQNHTCARGRLEKSNDGLALRFPRFTGKLVLDKNPEDSTNVNEIVTIFKNQKIH